MADTFLAAAKRIRNRAEWFAATAAQHDCTALDVFTTLSHVESRVDSFAALYAVVLKVYNGAVGDQQLMYHLQQQPEMQYLLRLLAESGSVGSSTSLSQTYNHVRWAELGQKVYQVSDGLGAKLSMTTLRGLRAEDVRLPQPAFIVLVPPSVDLCVPGLSFGVGHARNVLVLEDASPAANTRTWRLQIEVNAAGDFDFRTGQTLYWTLDLEDGKTLDACVSKAFNADVMSPDDVCSSAENAESLLQQTWNWLLNVIMYATTPDAEASVLYANPDAQKLWRRIAKAPKGRSRDEMKTRLRKLEPKPHTLLGESVSYTRALREMYECSRGIGSPLLVRTLVSGHWMRFATGVGRTERTWKYRDPFWRGPEDAPQYESATRVLR